MFVKIFDTNNPLVLIIVFIIGIFFWMNAFIHPPQITMISDTTPFYNIIYQLFSGKLYVSVFTAYLLLFLEAFLLNYMILQDKLFSRSSYLPAVIYILLMSIVFNLQTLSPVLLSNLFLLLSIQMIFNIYDEEDPYMQVFKAGFFTSIASLFYFPSLFFIIVIWIGLIVNKVFKWREWVIVLIGLLTPYFFVGVYLFCFNKLIILFQIYENYLRSIIFIKHSFDKPTYIFLILLGILSFVSIIKVLNENREKLIKIRLAYLVLLWFLIISVLLFFIGKTHQTLFFEISFIPLSVIIGNYLQHIKRTITKELIFIGFVLLIIMAKFNF